MRLGPRLFPKLAALCAVPFPVSLLAPGSAWGQTTLLVQGGQSLATQDRDVTAVGATVQFGAAALDANGHSVGDAEFSWTSTDEAVATHDTQTRQGRNHTRAAKDTG